MDSELLRRACEAAGLEWDKRLKAWRVGPPLRWMEPDHPALPAYVASLLVAKVRGREDGSGWKRALWRKYHLLLNGELGRDMPYVTDILATDEQRIRAALAALEGEK